jgi:bacillithiol synthase
MEAQCLPQHRLPGISRLFADYLTHFDRVERFYRHNPFDPASLERAAAEIQYPQDRRSAMAEALRAANGPSPQVDLFEQPGTVAVVTGQQVGLFGGPAYTIYKALTAARLAARLRDSGQPAVAIFWLATEDHDYEEIRRAWTFDANRQPVSLEVGASPRQGQPAGTVAIEQSPVETLRAALADFPFAAEVIVKVEQAYQPGETLGRAFANLIRDLLAPFGLIFLDPLDPQVRDTASPFLALAFEKAASLLDALKTRSQELEAAGYHSQVLVDGRSHMFFHLEDGVRRTLRLGDPDFADFSQRPHALSPNALLRPVMQDYLLPTVAYVGGPAEIAYLGQSHVLYEKLLGRMPVSIPRAGFTLLDSRGRKLLDRYRLNVPDVTVHRETLKEHISAALVPVVLEKHFAAANDQIGRSVDTLIADLLRFDPSLAKAMKKSRAKILYQLDRMAKKTAREALRRDERAQAEAAYLGGLLYPHEHLQERFYSMLPFLAQHGLDLPERLYEHVHLDCPDHQVLTL